MKRWQWMLQQSIRALGWPGMAGLALLVAAGALQLAMIRPAGRDIAALKVELARMRSHPAAERPYAPDEELALFYGFFPARGALAEQLRTVHRLAAERELSIERVDYKLSRIAGTPLWRYQMSFPLNTDYATLRRYLADVLLALPNAALEDVELQRAEPDAELLEEKVGLVLFFNGEPPR